MKKGETYLSNVWRNYDNQAIPMRITKIASGLVYYRPYYGKHDDGTDWLGSPAYFPIEQAHKWLDIEGGPIT